MVSEPKTIFEWNLRRNSEPEEYVPEVSQSVRKLFAGMSGIQTISLENSDDPVVITWSQNEDEHRTDSGYLADEGYFDVRDDVKGSTSGMKSFRRVVDQITFCNGSVLIFTEKGEVFNLSMKRLYRIR